MKAVLLPALFLSTFAAAQRVVDVKNIDHVDMAMFQVVGGEPFVAVKFVNLVEGSPYFKDQWLKGAVISKNNQIHRGGLYKLNLIDHELHYLDKGMEKIATTPVVDVTLFDTLTGESFHFIHASALPVASHKKGWYLELTAGKTSLYQFFKKQVHETKPYGSATAEQRIRTSEVFFLLHKGSMTEVKKLKDAATLLDAKNINLSSIEAQHKTLAAKLQSLVKQYNSLQENNQ